MAFTNDEVLKSFASTPGHELKNRKGSLFVMYDCLFSYGHHYEIARFLRRSRVFLVREHGNSSPTTNTHVSAARAMLKAHAKHPVIEVPAWLPRERLDPHMLCSTLEGELVNDGVSIPKDAGMFVDRLHHHGLISQELYKTLIGPPGKPRSAEPADPWDAIEGVV